MRSVSCFSISSNGRRSVLVALLLLVASVSPSASLAASTVVFQNDFESAALNRLPDDFLLLDGDFAVHEEAGNKFVELPGAPLDTYAVLFGPNEKEDISVSARIYGTNKGRRYPAFGIGSNGVAGYRLFVAPAKRRLELYRGDDVVTFVSYDWKPGTWLRLLLEVRKSGESSWTIRGRVWSETESEPGDWTITFKDDTEPFSGNASVWGKPFSGTPIRYDDLKILTLK